MRHTRHRPHRLQSARPLLAVLCGTVALVVGVGRAAPVRAAIDVTGSSSTSAGGITDDDRIWAGVTLVEGAWTPGSSSCTWGAYAGGTNLDTVPGSGVPSMTVRGVRYQLFVRVCPDQAVRAVWVPDIPPSYLARLASSVLARTVPSPPARFAPPAHRGVVRVGTWFWTDAGVWRPVAVTAAVPTTAGAMLWATTTATPAVLRLDPGDGRWGSGPRRCVGPGVAWLPLFGDRLPSPVGCSYTYRHPSVRAPGRQVFPARLVIEWEVTWRASNGTTGRAGRIESLRRVPVTVREVQALGVTPP